MTPERRSALVQKWGSVALLCGVVLALGLFAFAPLAQSAIEASDDVAAARERLSALRARRVDLAALEAALKLETARTSERPAAIEAASSAAGWEKMEAQLRAIAGANDAAVTSVRPLRLEEEGALKALRLEVSMRVAPDRLAALLSAIETAAPALFIERARVTRDEAARSGEDDRLDAALTVRALGAIAAPTASQTQARR